MNAKPALVRPSFASDLDSTVALWLTRMLLNKVAAITLLNDGIYSDELRRILGISPLRGEFTREQFRALLKVRAAELKTLPSRRKSVMRRNIELLAKFMGLNPLQINITLLTALSDQHPLMAEVIEALRIMTNEALIRFLATTFAVHDSEVRLALHPEGPLFLSRLVSIERCTFSGGVRLTMPSTLRSALRSKAESIQTLMRSFLATSPKSTLTAEAFEHMAPETELLSNYLSQATKKRMRGINILLYGPPGTGKTEYVRWLAAKLGQALFQVRATDGEGEPITGKDRLAYFQLSQRFLQNSGALIMFDEIEDIFPSDDANGFFAFQSASPSIGKMYVNHLLENNPIPTLWISNSVEHIDKAYLRRFDYSFEMDIPPLKVRRQILRQYLKRHRISETVIEQLAQQEALSPAQIEKGTKIMRLCGGKLAVREANLLRTIENSMALMDQKKVAASPYLSDCSYQLAYLNPDCDLPGLLAQLKVATNPVGALCFYGPPGTGKTALAHYLAKEIAKPLIVRRASDILGPYVGETEQRIAQMFRQAEDSQALLLLDEADSFLAERQSAKNSWEVTAVNEMLTQMERFEGLFICSTNLMDRLDAASLRRFALKVKFDYLHPDQRWSLFLAHLSTKPPNKEDYYRHGLNQLNTLTPGDFATVRRQSALFGKKLTADDWLHRLTLEVKAKGPIRRPIGFTPTA